MVTIWIHLLSAVSLVTRRGVRYAVTPLRTYAQNALSASISQLLPACFVRRQDVSNAPTPLSVCAVTAVTINWDHYALAVRIRSRPAANASIMRLVYNATHSSSSARLKLVNPAVWLSPPVSSVLARLPVQHASLDTTLPLVSARVALRFRGASCAQM